MKIELNEIEKAWLACAVDTDGHVGMKLQKQKQKGRTYEYVVPLLGFSNTHAGIVIYFAGLIEAKYHESRLPKPYDHKYKHSTITSSSEKVKQILTQIIPYMIVKKDRAIYVLNFCNFKLDNPGDHSAKSDRRQKEDLKWLEEYKKEYPSKRRNRGRVP